MRKIGIFIFVIGIGTGFLTGVWYSSFHKEHEKVAAEESDLFSFGKVVSVAKNKLTISEYSFASDNDVEMAYEVSPKTEFANIRSLDGIKQEDDIVLDYIVKRGKRIATIIVREEKKE